MKKLIQVFLGVFLLLGQFVAPSVSAEGEKSLRARKLSSEQSVTRL